MIICKCIVYLLENYLVYLKKKYNGEEAVFQCFFCVLDVAAASLLTCQFDP